MSDLVKLGLYELVWNHPPLPDGELLAKVANPHARRTYQQAIKRFYGCIERDPWLVTPPAIDDYKATLLYAYAPAVAAVHLQVIRELYDEAVERGLLASNPAAKTKPPELSPERGVRTPAREQAMEHAARSPQHTHAGRRERALALVVLHIGLSDAEINALRVGDFVEGGSLPAQRRRAAACAGHSPRRGQGRPRCLPTGPRRHRPLAALFLIAFVARDGAARPHYRWNSAKRSTRGAMSVATNDMTVINVFSDGPAVSLKGSPTVSPTTAAL